MKSHALLIWSFISGVILAAVLTMLVFFIIHTNQLASSTRATQHEGRREFCQLFQRNHHAAVTQLRQTITYLQRTDTVNDPLTQSIRANVPNLRSDVKNTRLPVVCKEVLSPVNIKTPKHQRQPKHGPAQHLQYRSNP